MKHKKAAARLNFADRIGLEPEKYATLTLHRPSNVDDKDTLQGILKALSQIAKELPIVFPIHPRTKKMADLFGLSHYFSNGSKVKGIWTTDPLGYLEFLHLNMRAKMVLTDSGGLQEETTVLRIPCITMRENTEGPITCDIGTNVIVGNKPDNILTAAEKILNGSNISGKVPEKWEGKAAERIVECLLENV